MRVTPGFALADFALADFALAASAAAWFAAWSVSWPAAAAEIQPPRNPNIVVDYIKPRPPFDPQDPNYAKAMAGYQRLLKIHLRLKERQVLEQLSTFLSPLKLPETLRIHLKPCGRVDAFYDGFEHTLNFCYEMLDAIEQAAPQTVSPDGITRQEAIVGGFLAVMLHEHGHALNDMFNIPVLGREEDAADQISGFLLVHFGKDVARLAVKGVTYAWLTWSGGGTTAYWDVHSTAGQRLTNYLCIAYGSDPATFKDLADKWLTPERVKNCDHEHAQVHNAFAKTFLPHVDQELMKQVEATTWIRPNDGTWD
jgi:hypothetical protein